MIFAAGAAAFALACVCILHTYPGPAEHARLALGLSVSALAFAVFGLCVFLWGKRLPPERFFLAFGVLFGLTFLFATPPFGVPDEPVHYLKATAASQGRLFMKEENGKLVLPLRGSDAVFYDAFEPRRQLVGYENLPFTLRFLRSPANGPDKTETLSTIYNSYNPVEYLPAAVGVGVGNLLRLHPLLVFYLGRLFNLAFYLLCTFWAIRRLPYGNNILCLVALLPMTLQLAASFSADAVILAVLFLYTAHCLALAASGRKLCPRDVARTAGLSAVIALCKPVYLPACLLCLAVPPVRYRTKARYFIAAGSVLFLSFGVWLGWMLATRRFIGMSNDMLTAAQIAQNVRFVRSRPILLPGMMARTMGAYAQFYLTTMIGGSLCWLNANLNGALVNLLAIVLLAAALFRPGSEKKNAAPWQKALFALIALSVTALMYLSEFITWTRPGNPLIDGIQGRYFLPVLPLLLLVFRNRFFSLKKIPTALLQGSFLLLDILALMNFFTLIF